MSAIEQFTEYEIPFGRMSINRPFTPAPITVGKMLKKPFYRMNSILKKKNITNKRNAIYYLILSMFIFYAYYNILLIISLHCC